MPPKSALRPTITENVQSLLTGAVGTTRQKGIITLARRKNISREDAKFHQALKIAASQSRKNG